MAHEDDIAFAATIRRAAELLRTGGLVAFPTETVYGLGANALDAAAVRRIFRAKGRPATNPIIVHVANARAAREVVADWPPIADRLAEHFWPGPLTLVLAKNRNIPDEVTAGGPTVAVRAPNHPVAQAILAEAGVPVAAPSANRSTNISPTTAEHVARGLAGAVDLIVDGGPTTGGIESTVLDVSTERPRILRPGLVTAKMLEAVIGPIAIMDADAAAPLRSPGMMPRHYAPITPMQLVLGDGRELVRERLTANSRIGWLTWPDAPKLPVAMRIELPRDPIRYAAGLYVALHAFDAAGLEVIIAAQPPDEPDWQAVRDRLTRASR